MENKKPVIVGIGELLWDVLPTGLCLSCNSAGS